MLAPLQVEERNLAWPGHHLFTHHVALLVGELNNQRGVEHGVLSALKGDEDIAVRLCLGKLSGERDRIAPVLVDVVEQALRHGELVFLARFPGKDKVRLDPYGRGKRGVVQQADAAAR